MVLFSIGYDPPLNYFDLTMAILPKIMVANSIYSFPNSEDKDKPKIGVIVR